MNDKALQRAIYDTLYFLHQTACDQRVERYLLDHLQVLLNVQLDRATKPQSQEDSAVSAPEPLAKSPR